MARDLILLLGSYNGQDSLGDECLLKCAIDQYRRAAPGKSLEFALHAHLHTPLLERMEAAGELVANRGLQSAFWLLRTQLRHTHLPYDAYQALAAAVLPAYYAAAAATDQLDARDALDQIARARLLHIFGGTNFSFQWFALNAPFFFATSALLKLRGRPTYCGPQQYGPMSAAQLAAFKAWLASCVRDYRSRNPRCVELLGGDPAVHLISDEVYSNRSLYPIEGARPRRGEYILVNVRGGSMSDDSVFDAAQLDAIGQTLVKVYGALGLPYRFFAVSNAELTEDLRSFEALAERLQGRAPIENVGRVADEQALMTLADHAYGCISMSFHGCILSGFRGIPAIPITSGPYYDYKYIGFDQYGDGRPIPILSLAHAASGAELDAVIAFLRDYDAAAAARMREAAAGKIEHYYRSIAAREL